MNKRVKELSDGVYVYQYDAQGNSVAVAFGKASDKLTDMHDTTEGGGKDKGKFYIPRGKNDRKLLEFHKLVSDSPNKGQFLETKENFIAGRGVALFEEDADALSMPLPFKSESFYAWKRGLKLDDYVSAAVPQINFGYEINVLMHLDPTTKKVASLQVIDNNDVRLGIMKESDLTPQYAYISTEFGSNKPPSTEKQCIKVKIFDKDEPLKHSPCLIHEIVPFPGQKIYGMATWWGTKEWALQANKVPIYYEAAFRNGFLVTHEVRIPSDYWDKEEWDKDRREKEKKKTLDTIAETLSGVENANKIVFTFTNLAVEGRQVQGVEIKPVDYNLKDDAFIKMFEAANSVQSQGHGLPGKLAGVEMGSNLGTSGLEINSLSTYTQNFLVNKQRALLLKPLIYAKEIDKIEPDKVLGIKNILSYVYDSTKQADPANVLTKNGNSNVN